MIRAFRNRLAEDLFHERLTSRTRRFPSELRSAASRRLQYLNAAVSLGDLAVVPGNRLEALKGDRRGCHAIRINDQWRIVFHWQRDGVDAVEVTDYH
ncbi:MAG TPA: type II toxin-antitoxin system RelE/ParE family toxin [Candidatus Acidoferrum sp.]|nr:type II toxin-antitoxin system RelE/ParE family toxin [Candidatus Acidoferrum sp.]